MHQDQCSNLIKQPIINKIKNRILFLSPTVQAGLERECTKSDFFREGDKCIGKGGFGEVWKVAHRETGKTYAIKILDKKHIIEKKLVEQINREIDIMYKVNHPHLMKLVNHFEDEEKIYMIMPFASQGMLYKHLKKNGRFDQRNAAQILRETIEAVRYLHSFNPPIIHRDIKPENLLLDEKNRIKLTDFGWSNFKTGEENRQTYCGTPDYLAPEMVKQQGHDHRVDIWSIGVLLYELIAGQAPFSAPCQNELFLNIKKIKINWPPDFPPLAKNLVSKILKANPKERISLDEIMMHSWFEQNPPIRPVLITCQMDEKELLKSHLINVSSDLLKNEINQLVSSKDTEETRRSGYITKNMMNHRDPSNELKSVLIKIQQENDTLTKENLELKGIIVKMEAEYKNLKIENSKLKDMTNTDNLNKEIQQLLRDAERYKILNEERLTLLSEIEDKNEKILITSTKIIQLEAELKESIRKIERLTENNNGYCNEIKEYEIKIEEFKKKISNQAQENEELALNYQKKIESLQFKFFDNTDELSSDSDRLSQVIELLQESINDLNIIFQKKVSKVFLSITEYQENLSKNESTLSALLIEKHSLLIDLITKFRNGLQEEITNALRKAQIQYEKKSKGSEMLEWLKKQISELQPYKNKNIINESKISQLQDQMKILQGIVEMSEIKADTLEKVNNLVNQNIKEVKYYSESLENQLSDVKDFVFQNCPDQLDEFWLKFHEYYPKSYYNFNK